MNLLKRNKVFFLITINIHIPFGTGTFELTVDGSSGVLVAESVGSVQACVELTSGPLPSDTNVTLETRDDTAIGNLFEDIYMLFHDCVFNDFWRRYITE